MLRSATAFRPDRLCNHPTNREDAILISHGHFDPIHDAIPLAARFRPKVVSLYETCQRLASKGVQNTSAMDEDGSQAVGPVTVTMTHAVHSGGILDDGKVLDGGEAGGYALRFAARRAVYFSGNTNVFSAMSLIRKMRQPSPAVLPVGGLFTMSPPETAMACRLWTLEPDGGVVAA